MMIFTAILTRQPWRLCWSDIHERPESGKAADAEHSAGPRAPRYRRLSARWWLCGVAQGLGWHDTGRGHQGSDSLQSAWARWRGISDWKKMGSCAARE